MVMDSFIFNGGFELIFFIVFALVLGAFIFVAVREITEWHRNNQSPRLTVDAVVTTKRTDVRRHADAGYATRYYVTFQVESGDRMELCVPGREYGILAEGDCGRLQFQGNRYLSFDRTGTDA